MTEKTTTIKHTGVGEDVCVRADSARNMARAAADILARREFGKRGTVVAMRLANWSEDGKAHTYEAFIGLEDGCSISGRNVWIYA